MTLPVYTHWKSVPRRLYGRDGLRGLGLAPTHPAQALLHDDQAGARVELFDARLTTLLPVPAAAAPRACPACGGERDPEYATCKTCSKRASLHRAYQNAERVLRAARDGDLVVIDTETTGLEDTDEVVEVSIVHQRDGLLLDTLVRPSTGVIPEAASNINGITTEQVAEAPAWATVAPRVQAALSRGLPVAWNAPFDARMLTQSSALAGVELAFPEILCGMEAYALATEVSRRRRGLEKAARVEGVLRGALDHRGASDARLTIAVLELVAARDAVPAGFPQ